MLGWELNANQYRVVHLAARYDLELEWFYSGHKSAAASLAERLEIETGTAREWMRVGHMLGGLPLIDAAFAANELSFAKARILTRSAEPDNEADLLELARSRPANRLSAAIARFLAETEDDDEGRDARHHEARSLTSYTDGDGMVVIRVVLAPLIAKAILAAIEQLVRRIAKTPIAKTPIAKTSVETTEPTGEGDPMSLTDTPLQRLVGKAAESLTNRDQDLSADSFGRRCVNSGSESTAARDRGFAGEPGDLSKARCTCGPDDSAEGCARPGSTADECGRRSVVDLAESLTNRDQDLSADSFGRRSVNDEFEPTAGCGCDAEGDAPSLQITLAELRRRWQPGADSDDEWTIPTMAQQRADAFAAFFLGLDIDLTTEVVIHVRGDGNTFDDGTPLTDNAVAAQLDHSFIQLLIHDAERRPVDASSSRRYPTARQRRVALEAHNHECVDCAATDLLEFDHNPPYHQTRRTVTNELEVRCAPCHRARHRSTTPQATPRR